MIEKIVTSCVDCLFRQKSENEPSFCKLGDWHIAHYEYIKTYNVRPENCPLNKNGITIGVS